MGRTDGSGRMVSADSVDDSATGILHVDMDAFYAAVAVLDHPELTGKPVIIAGISPRSVVSSASYEARRFGIRAAMPLAQALRRCPQAQVVAPVFARYQDLSARVMQVFESFTPLVEPLSIDEAFLDVRGATRVWGSPAHIARLIRARVLADVGITCSVGVAATKHVAKMASTLAKPDGLLVVPGSQTQLFLDVQPVQALWGVGPKTVEKLNSRAIFMIADLRRTPQSVLVRLLGHAQARHLMLLAQGIDAREIVLERIEKSVSHEETFDEDISDPEQLNSKLLELADRVGARLRRGGLVASTIAIKVRFADFSTVSRSQTLVDPTAVGERIAHAARSMFGQLQRSDPVRLIGIRAENLNSADQNAMLLWDEDESWRRVDAVRDGAVDRFGQGAIKRARHLKP